MPYMQTQRDRIVQLTEPILQSLLGEVVPSHSHEVHRDLLLSGFIDAIEL
jgi:hypothetical protein